MSQSSLTGASATEVTLQHRICEDPSKLWERLWLWVTDRINPIVVKEVRQSLKSRQFTISFGLTLLAAISWTLFAVSIMVPRIYYVPAGLPLLTGFFCILNLPLMVIIPFGAFRSLASETEDSTFELLSISALSSIQIIYGKMASAGVQIVLFLSALAPCIVLTYLLRGVSLFTILFVLSLTLLFSVLETALALLFASMSRSRMIQNLTSVLALAGLLIGFFAWCSLIISILQEDFLDQAIMSEPGITLAWTFAIATIAGLLGSLILRTASAAIDFPSENNSTTIRLRVFGLVSLSFFWAMYGIAAIKESAALLVLGIAIFILLMFVGSLVSGERGIISPRAQRGLPKTFLGRVFLTWFYPGAGLGYVLIVCLFGAFTGTAAAFSLYFGSELRNNVSAVLGCYLLLCYLAIYLGINRLIMLLLPKELSGRLVGSFALLVVILLLSHLLPLLVAFYAANYRNIDYTAIQSFNIFWTLYELDRADLNAAQVVLTITAIAVFGANLILCTRDVLLVRVALPSRVREDDTPVAPEAVAQPVDPFA